MLSYADRIEVKVRRRKTKAFDCATIDVYDDHDVTFRPGDVGGTIREPHAPGERRRAMVVLVRHESS